MIEEIKYLTITIPLDGIYFIFSATVYARTFLTRKFLRYRKNNSNSFSATSLGLLVKKRKIQSETKRLLVYSCTHDNNNFF